jgi:hypothetical protein
VSSCTVYKHVIVIAPDKGCLSSVYTKKNTPYVDVPGEGSFKWNLFIDQLIELQSRMYRPDAYSMAFEWHPTLRMYFRMAAHINVKTEEAWHNFYNLASTLIKDKQQPMTLIENEFQSLNHLLERRDISKADLHKDNEAQDADEEVKEPHSLSYSPTQTLPSSKPECEHERKISLLLDSLAEDKEFPDPGPVDWNWNIRDVEDVLVNEVLELYRSRSDIDPEL